MPLGFHVQLPLRDALLIVAGAGVTVHFIFQRWEPAGFISVPFLLIVLPCALSCLFVEHYDLTKAILLSFATCLGSLIGSIALYRLSPVHPLARYPGPVLCKLSVFWLLRVARQGRRHSYIRSLHEQYGEIVRIAPNEVSICNVSAVQPLMGTTGFPKGPGWAGRTMHVPLQPLIAIGDAAEHARRRKPWNRAFSTNALKEYEPIIQKRTRQLIEELEQKGGVVDISKMISYFTYDFMSDMAFGGGSEMLRDGDKDGMWKALDDGIFAAVTFETVPWLASFARHLPGVGEALKRLRGMGIARATARRQKGSTTKDLFYYLNNDDGAEVITPAPAQVVSDGLLAIVAGSDTTATVLSNVFYCLLNNVDTYKRLQKEVDTYYPPGEDALNPEKYSSMIYLDAVINETMRLFPAVLSGSQRAPRRGSGGKAVGPYFIPEGNQARIHFLSLHRNPRNFYPAPDLFWPERWLIAEGAQPNDGVKLIHNLNAFIPFSLGPWNCVGKNLALQEMRMVVCHCMQNLQMRFADEWDPAQWERGLEDVFVTKTGRLPVVVTSRRMN